jgi:hypothetical protein
MLRRREENFSPPVRGSPSGNSNPAGTTSHAQSLNKRVPKRGGQEELTGVHASSQAVDLRLVEAVSGLAEKLLGLLLLHRHLTQVARIIHHTKFPHASTVN